MVTSSSSLLSETGHERSRTHRAGAGQRRAWVLQYIFVDGKMRGIFCQIGRVAVTLAHVSALMLLVGPLEWCWRSLTYWSKQPMRVRETTAAAVYPS